METEPPVVVKRELTKPMPVKVVEPEPLVPRSRRYALRSTNVTHMELNEENEPTVVRKNNKQIYKPLQKMTPKRKLAIIERVKIKIKA